jgi:CDP-diacylglycerol--serine O-phosphatidyltransferase
MPQNDLKTSRMHKISEISFAGVYLLLPLMKHLPNALTLANLFCGCCALLYTLYWQPEIAVMFTVGSFFFDYLDGMVARALHISSPMGKELDSLADVVSFGVVPGAMLFQLLSSSVCGNLWTAFSPASIQPQICLAALPAFVLSAFSGLRLAKFNLDTRQANYFIGLSTPACTVFVLGLFFAAHYDRFGLKTVIENQWFLYTLILVLSWLLMSEIPMFGMKIKRLDWKSNVFFLVLLALFAVLIIVLKELALSAIIVCYIVISVIFKNKITTT